MPKNQLCETNSTRKNVSRLAIGYQLVGIYVPVSCLDASENDIMHKLFS